jgi:hypothetical protein
MFGSFAEPYGHCKRMTVVRSPEMTANSRNEAQPASLSLSQVSRLIELERIEMDRRVAARREASSNVIPFKARPAERVIEMSQHPLRRSHG